MKLTRKLIPAFAMLLVSAVLMSTASFAWFSMNQTVTASGMSITAQKADDIFLEIVAGKAEDVTTDTVFDVTDSNNFTAADGLLPVAHNTITLDLENETVSESIEKLGNWYYKVGTDVNNAHTGESAAKPITSLDSYVAKTYFTVRANPNAQGTIYGLYVSNITITDVQGGVTIIIAGANGYQEFTAETDGEQTFAAANILSDEVSDPQTITVYVFIDGNHDNVYTNNRDNLGGSIEFTLKAFAESQN